MPKLMIRARLGTCGRCGGKLGNPLTHVCITRAGKPRRRTRTRIRPKVSVAVKCKTCGKPYANPLTHVCTVKTDFRRKLATAPTVKPSQRKPRRVTVTGPGGQQQHPAPSACRDGDCERKACVAYRDGYADGLAGRDERR